MSLFDFKLWIVTNRVRYRTYLDDKEYLYYMDEDTQMNFVLLVWHSEGCPEI